LLCLREKLDVFQANGFDVKEADDGQLLLAAVPYSKDTVFGMQDALELLHLLISRHSAPFQMSSQAAGDTTGKVVRPSRSGIHPPSLPPAATDSAAL
jgi:DNA mismatch repair ATPase MutL